MKNVHSHCGEKNGKPSWKEDNKTPQILLLTLCHELVVTSIFLSFLPPHIHFFKDRNRIIEGTSWCQVFPPLGTECEGCLEVEPSGTQHLRTKLKETVRAKPGWTSHTVLPVLCGLSSLPPSRFLWGPRDCCWVGVGWRTAPHPRALNMHLLNLPTCEAKLHLPPSYRQTLPSLYDVFFHQEHPPDLI